jgi:membrane fusion protein
MDLFRSEALAHQQQKLLGEILLTRPLSMQILSWAAFCVAIIIVGFVIWGDYTKKQRVIGVLMPDKGMIRIYPQQPGTVLALKVKEGETVRKGQILYVLTSERIAAGGQATQAALHHQLEAQRTSLQQEAERQTILNESAVAALQQRVQGLRRELTSIQQALSLSSQQIQLSNITLKRYKELADQHFLSAAQLQVRQEEHINQLMRRKDLERDQSNLQREIAVATEELASIGLKGQNQLAAIARNINEVDQSLLEVEAKREVQVVAPDNGVISAILAKPGQTVGNSPLLTLLPTDSALEAELYIPSRAVGFIKPGKKVLLRYQAYPYEKFGQPEGVVTTVSRAPIPANELSYTLPNLPASNEAYYRLEVAIPKQTIRAYGKEEPLQAGMALEADVLLETRKLYEWLFEPLYSLTSKV